MFARKEGCIQYFYLQNVKLPILSYRVTGHFLKQLIQLTNRKTTDGFIDDDLKFGQNDLIDTQALRLRSEMRAITGVGLIDFPTLLQTWLASLTITSSMSLPSKSRR
jgi:hypothetical protein